MNKSTPISQIPVQQQPMVPPTFQQDQAKQPTEVLADDDATIQEVLNQINLQHPSTQQAPSPPPPQQLMPPQISLTQPMPQQLPPPYIGDMYAQQQMMMPPAVSNTTNTLDMFVNIFADDIKLALLVFVVVVAIHFIPVADVLNRYIAVDKIPYHDVIIRGLICALCVVALRKFIPA
jgi:hypothetical protein